MNTFGDGVNSMARNCQASLQLVRRGKWTLDDFDKWLSAVLDQDPNYLAEALPMILKKMEKPDQ